MTKDMSAPGRLELVRVFVNSLDLDHPERDPFLSPDGAREWLAGHGLREISGVGTGELPDIRLLRDALRGELLAHTHELLGDPGEDEGPSEWPALADQLTGTLLTLELEAGGDVCLAPADKSALGILRGAIAARVYESVRNGEWRRLKVCRKASCLFAFYDRCKNATGTWCDMAVCGNRVKAQRRRARDRGRASSGISA